MYEYKATIDRWVDGDTVDVNIDLGFERVHMPKAGCHATCSLRVNVQRMCAVCEDLNLRYGDFGFWVDWTLDFLSYSDEKK